MHEMAICQALLEQIEGIAREHSARVSRVHLAVGPLSGVEPRLLERAYELASTGTAAQNSELLIEDTAVRVRCRACGAESAAHANRLLCAECGNWQTELTGGDELLLLKVELSKERLAVTAQP
jgi:hydrogenase nickel incorporation protein HypA/HybF